MPTSTLSDRLLATLKNNRVVAVIFVVAAIIGGVAQFTNALGTIIRFICPDDRSSAIYRPLVADLGNLDRAMHGLGVQINMPGRDRSFVESQIRIIEVAAEPIFSARKSVSELGDTTTRKELDAICLTVTMLNELAKHTEGGVGGIALAGAIDSLGTIRKLRERLQSHLSKNKKQEAIPLHFKQK